MSRKKTHTLFLNTHPISLYFILTLLIYYILVIMFQTLSASLLSCTHLPRDSLSCQRDWCLSSTLLLLFIKSQMESIVFFFFQISYPISNQKGLSRKISSLNKILTERFEGFPEVKL